MNYANMIEEKSLKRSFIIATLISTIAGTFTTGINLYDRLAEKRKQIKTDKSQDDKIKQLERRVDQVEDTRNRSSQRDDDLRRSLEYSGPMVRREYDQRYSQLGSRFAEGDIIAQTQLQSQIITLQSTVIKLLEEALLTGKTPDIARLYNASEFAREGTIRALQNQYQRMLQGLPVQRPVGPVRRISSTPTLQSSSSEVYRHPKKSSTFSAAGPLFCPYAEYLQRSNRRLGESFHEGGSGLCPECGAFIAVESDRSWKITKEVIQERVSRSHRGSEIVNIIEDRIYLLSNRFIIKCHREGRGYACYLCFRHRPTDTLWKGMDSLANHILEDHDINDYETDPDIRDVTPPYHKQLEDA